MAAMSSASNVGVEADTQNKENDDILVSHIDQATVDNVTHVDGNVMESRPRTWSPRRMQDIHLDGTVDDMQNVDPYLLEDKDLDIRSDIGGVNGSVSTLVSPRSASVKSGNISRRQKLKSAGTPNARSNAGSRARQLKDHEGSPFLSIDLKQDSYRFTPEFISGKMSRTSMRESHHSSLLSVSTTGLTSNSVKSSAEFVHSARSQRGKLFSSSSVLLPSKTPSQPNHNIKMPFKHSVKKVDMKSQSLNPSTGLKDRTAMATHTLNKLVQAQKPTHTTYVQGRLLKARLKPLEPVKMSEPTIHHCRGIVAEMRQYGQSESRTFQRWKAIMSGGHHLPDKTQHEVRDGASTSQSVQHTSEASTPEPRMDFPYDPNQATFENCDWAQELEGSIPDENGLAEEVPPPDPFSLPNSRCAPRNCDSDINELCGPDLNNLTADVRDAATPVAADYSMDTSMISTMPDSFVQRQPNTNSISKQEREDTSNGVETSDIVDGSIVTESVDQNLDVVLNKRPKSAVYTQDSAPLHPPPKGRPKTAVDSSSRKAVRFADESENRLTGKEKGSKSKSSCRPRSLDSGFHDRDDKRDGDDEDGACGGGGGGGGGGRRGGGEGRIFLTQGSSRSGNNTQGQTKRESSSQGTKRDNSERKDNSSSLLSKSNLNHVPLLETGSLEIVGKKDGVLSATVCYVEKGEQVSAARGQQKSRPVSSPHKSAVHRNKKKFETFENTNKKIIPASTKKTLMCEKKDCEEMEKTNGKVCDDVAGSSLSLICKQDSSDSGISVIGEETDHFMEKPIHVKPNHKIIRASSANSMKRIKAYKTIVEKSKRGGGRPYSASVYQDVEIKDKKSTNKARLGLRPASATGKICSEISHIKSKYGLNSAGGRMPPKKSSGTGKPSVTFSSTSSPNQVIKRGESYQEKTLALSMPEDRNCSDTNGEDESMSCMELALYVENSVANHRASLRLKSASKVTFADEDEYEDDDKASRKSALTSAKSYSQTSSILRGSSSCPDSSVAAFHSSCSSIGVNFDETDDADYNQMWDDLPDDCSDIQDSAKNNCDEFMSKFDVLQNQFNSVAAELAAERGKYQEDVSKSYVPSSMLAVCCGTESKSVEESKQVDTVSISEEEMAEIRASGYKLESGPSIFVTDSSSVEDTPVINDAVRDEDETDDKEVEGRVKTPSEFLQYEEPCWLGNKLVEDNISVNLYKKTNRYVEVKHSEKENVKSFNDAKKDKNKKSGGVSSRVDHGQRKNLCKQARHGMKDGKMEQTEDGNKNGTFRKPVYKTDDEENAANFQPIKIPCIEDSPFMCEGTAKLQSQRSSRTTTPVSDNRRPDSAVVTCRRESVTENRDGQTNSETKKETQSRNLKESSQYSVKDSQKIAKSDSSFTTDRKPVENVADRRESDVNYYELLLAYRSHCMEDSDEDDEDEDDNNNNNNNDNDGDKTVIEDVEIPRLNIPRGGSVERKGNDKRQVTDLADDGRKINNVKNDDKNNKSDEKMKSPDVNPRHTVARFETGHEDRRLSCVGSEGDAEAEIAEGKDDTDTGVKVRPISATTTDSGMESDSPAEEGGAYPCPSDQSKERRKERGQSKSRPDSGVLCDELETRSENTSQPVTLEIVASAKTINKTRPSSANQPRSEQEMEKLSQFPPLCFKLNARPPAGFLYYFAYGPNMNPDRIACYLGSEKSPPRFWALLFGFGIAFNMKGSASSEIAEGFPNLEWNPQTSVEGCVYQITPVQLQRLDKFVGYPTSLEHVVLPVWMSNSLDPDLLGVAQYCVPALTYIAKDDYTWNEPVPASEYAVSQCIKSADLVTPEFKGHLSSFSSVAGDSCLAVVAAV